METPFAIHPACVQPSCPWCTLVGALPKYQHRTCTGTRWKTMSMGRPRHFCAGSRFARLDTTCPSGRASAGCHRPGASPSHRLLPPAACVRCSTHLGNFQRHPPQLPSWSGLDHNQCKPPKKACLKFTYVPVQVNPQFQNQALGIHGGRTHPRMGFNWKLFTLLSN